MKNPQIQRTATRRFTLAPVALGCAAMVIASSAAYAQSTTDANLGVVTVTGIRKGIEDAISVKRNNDTIVEAISAEDIGKLPDTTIAESLARLPGVTTQRTKSGAASTISIRGLGPDFNGYLLNGREQTSTGDSRAVDLSVYPAELIGGATVYKTGDAALMSAGLAGTIDNLLIDPLAFPGRVLVASAQKVRSGIGLEGVPEGTGNRASLTYIDQFADRTLGIAMGFVRVDGTSNETGSGGWGGGSTGAVTQTDGTTVQAKNPDTWGNGVDFKNRTVTDKRTGVAAIIAYKPNAAWRSQLDLFYAKADTTAKEARFQAGLNFPITNATVVNGVAVKGTYQLPVGSFVNRIESVFDDDTVKSIGWKNTLKMSNGWTAILDISSNSATRIERDIEAYAGIPTADTFTFDNTGGTPKFTLGRATDYTNPAIIKVRDQSGWSGVTCPDGQSCPQAGYSKGPNIKDEVNAVRLDFKSELASGGMFSEVAFGGNYSDRSKTRTTDEGLLVSATNNGRDAFAFPSDAYVASNIAGTGINLLTFDPTAGLWPGATILRKYNDDILSKSWSVQEKVMTGYVKFGIDTNYANIPWRGGVGMQVVNTDQSSGGFQAGADSSPTLNNPAKGFTTAGQNYTDVLPSLNLTGDMGNGNLLRFALSSQIARPTLTDMRNSFAASEDKNAGNSTFGHFVGSAGNPMLKPFKATAVDVSYEKYFGKKGYFSAAAFYKKLDTYITPATNTAYDFTNYKNALGLATPASGSNVGVFTTTVNGTGGNLQGFELAVSAPFNLVTTALDGFGVSASLSKTDSSVNMPNLIGLNPTQQVPTDSVTMQLPGLSKDNAKLTLYFEKWGFSAFVASNYRSTYVGSVANDAIGGYPTLRYIEGSTWVSAQIGYEFYEGPMKGLGLRLEGNNLNRPVYRQLKADGSVDSENKTGSTMMFKLTYKLQ